MAGVYPIPLDFASDADIAIDFLLQKNGSAVNLTGYGVSVAFANQSGQGGFEVHVGAGVLTPASDGYVRIRIPASEAADLAGRYSPCELKLMPGDGTTPLWLTFVTRIWVGAAQIIGASSPLTSGPLGTSAQTITVNWTDGGITVDASPGVAGASLLEGFIAAGTLPPTASWSDVIAYYLTQLELAILANQFFAQETDALADGATWHSTWRSAGVAAGGLSALGSFNAQVTSDQPVSAWIEYSDDGATPLGQTPTSNLGPETGAVPLSLPLCAEYFRVGIQNESGGSANVTAKASFNR